jgi:L-lactate utilization protein LutC
MVDARQIVFGKIANALNDGHEQGWLPSEPPDPINWSPEEARCLNESPADTLWEEFARSIEALGDSAHRFPKAEEARDHIAAMVKDRDLGGGVIEEDAHDFLQIAADSNPFEHLKLSKEGRDTIFESGFGITLVDAAVAETGSLAITASSGRSRLASLAPHVHFAVFSIDRLLPDLVDLVAFQNQEKYNHQMWTWITGSSRTADIDGILIRGAHGPKELVAICIG